jgi:hypothetical protein
VIDVDDKYIVGALTTRSGREVRLVFWDGKLVGSAMAPEPSKKKRQDPTVIPPETIA